MPGPESRLRSSRWHWAPGCSADLREPAKWRSVADQPDVAERIGKSSLPVDAPRRLMVAKRVEAALRAGFQGSSNQLVRILAEDFHSRRCDTEDRGALPPV